MNLVKLLKAWGFIIFQVVMAWFFVGPQIIKSISGSLSNTVTWILFGYLFFIMNWWLAIRSYKRERRTSSLKPVIVYSNWVLIWLPLFVLSLVKCRWTETDTVISGSILVLSVIVVVVGWALNRELTDPLIRGLLIGLLRVVPHLYLTVSMITAGKADLVWTTIIAGHITVSCRLLTLFRSCRQSGWERSVATTFWSEFMNEASWLIVTITRAMY